MRSHRKTLAIKITPMCEILVLAPKKCSIEYIDKFVYEKQNWIKEKLKQQEKNKVSYNNYVSLQVVMVFGQDYQIVDCGGYYQIGNYQIKHTKANNKNLLIRKFLNKLANEYIPTRVEFIANKLNLSYRDIKIISARKSWGSCNSLRQLKFNFRLVMLPKNLIDYVICHELCHLKELNHSKKFWTLLENLGYKKTVVKQAFKQYGFVLQLY